MPRQARIDAPGALQHLIVRGIERRLVFRDAADRAAFLGRLGTILKESATSCYAWVLMPNHVHLLVRTGTVPLATVMRRLLTGYAGTFNRRHRRHGPLFQNRYKSILCQEEAYLLELVRYIHLNPLRGRLVGTLEALDAFPYGGHSVLMGQRTNDWQDTHYVLGHFGQRVGAARRRYRAFIAEGLGLGRRPELVGGGLIRSLGGWAEVKTLRRGQGRMKGDERVLGDSGFVQAVLAAADERLQRQDHLRAQGYTLERIARRVATVLGVEPDEVAAPGKQPERVAARSLFCFWAVRELGYTATALARMLGLTQPAVSIAVQRGEILARRQGLALREG
jgi:REP element-mobilizing transposase RayT